MNGSAFHDPARYRGLLLVPPPTVHIAAYVTGGLKDIYANVLKKQVRPDHEGGLYTDSNGHFIPQQTMPLLALRYRFMEVFGRGQSSVIIKAQDTFNKDQLVAIKVLHTTYFPIGSQEADIMLEINQDDPSGYVPIVRLLNVFSFDDHYCLTFDVLHSDPITNYFKEQGFTKDQSIPVIREVALKLLSVMGFLYRVNIIHADLKPDNILLGAGKQLSGLKVVDFGNAIRCIRDELSLYYSDYELQTLIYRAPEVTMGLQFGLEVDMWSLGCILVELYIGQPIFLGGNKDEVLQKITTILGPLPREFQKGMFYSQFSQFVGNPFNKYDAMKQLNKVLGQCRDWNFVDFLYRLLAYKPRERLTPSTAATHPFLAPILPCLYLTPTAGDLVESNLYRKVLLDRSTYPFQVDRGIHQNRDCSTFRILKQGTKETLVWRGPYGEETPPSTSPERNDHSLEEENSTESASTNENSSSKSQEPPLSPIKRTPVKINTAASLTKDEISSSEYLLNGTKKKARLCGKASPSLENGQAVAVSSKRHLGVIDISKSSHASCCLPVRKLKVKRKNQSTTCIETQNLAYSQYLSSSDDDMYNDEPLTSNDEDESYRPLTFERARKLAYMSTHNMNRRKATTAPQATNVNYSRDNLSPHALAKADAGKPSSSPPNSKVRRLKGCSLVSGHSSARSCSPVLRVEKLSPSTLPTKRGAYVKKSALHVVSKHCTQISNSLEVTPCRSHRALSEAHLDRVGETADTDETTTVVNFISPLRDRTSRKHVVGSQNTTMLPRL